MRKTRFVLFIVLIGLATIHCPKTPPPDSNESPQAVLSANPLEGDAPLEVEFDASSSTDPDGMIDSLFFDFGDGNGYVGISFKEKHSYISAGIFSASVVVKDDEGAKDTASVIITAHDAAGINRDNFESTLVWWVNDNATLSFTGDGWLEMRSQTAEDSYLRSGSYDLANLNRFAIFLWPGHDFHIGFSSSSNPVENVRFYANGNPPQLKAVVFSGGQETSVDFQSPISLSNSIGLEFEFLDSQVNLNVSDDGNTWVKAHEVLVDEVTYQKLSFSIGVFDTPNLGHAVIDWTEISYGQASAMRRQMIWDANTEPDLAGYIVEQVVGGDTARHTTQKTFFEFVQDSSEQAFRVFAFDFSNNISQPSHRVVSKLRDEN